MIELTNKDIEFILSLPSVDLTTKEILEYLKLSSSKDISDDLAEKLRDFCIQRLDTHGFDIEYNPTTEGKKLENLIDKLYIG